MVHPYVAVCHPLRQHGWLFERAKEGDMSEVKLLLLSIGAVLFAITVAALIGLSVARRLDKKRALSRYNESVPTDRD